MKSCSKFTAAIIAFASLCLGASSSAHDFWIHPDRFVNPDTSPTRIDLRIGHADDTSPWPLAVDRVIALRSIGPDGVTDHLSAIQPSSRSLKLRFSPGLHVLTIETQDAISELPARQFNAYVEEEGLTPIRLDRVSTSRMSVPGVERYSRRGKSLIAIGDWANHDDAHLMRPVGMTLELVPLENPYRLGVGETFPVRVHYRGQPQTGVTVEHIRLDKTGKDTKLVSDKDGLIEVTYPETGDWMLHAVWSSALPARAQQDYDTIFGSLTYTTRK